MKYKASSFSHRQPDRIGVLITNLGTPEAPTAKALGPYLKQFLSDPRVVEIPRLLWWLILNGIILRVRPKKSAQAYASVWTDEGSPLMTYTKRQAEGLRQRLTERHGDRVVLDFAMRYGNPDIQSAVQRLQDQGVRKLLLLPLYPQYSASTSGSTFDALAEDFTHRRWLPDLRFVSHYHDFQPWVDACVQQIRGYQQQHGQPDKLILSYHGVPLRYLHNGDPYFCECHKSSRLIAEALGLTDDQYLTTFQSRFGREEWLQPYTDQTMKSLPSQGVKHVQVFCPGFSSDCLETIEEIAEENREYFMENGGEQFNYIPALNDLPEHLDALHQLIEQNLVGWLESAGDNLDARLQRAKALGSKD